MMKNISFKSIVVWRIRVTLVMFLLYFLLGTISVFYPILALKLIIIFFIFYIFFIFIYSKMMYTHINYILNKNALIIYNGVFFLKKTFIYINKIQYIEISQSLEEKIFKVCTIIFYTAGSKITLPQIELIDGINIKEKIMGECK